MNHLNERAVGTAPRLVIDNSASNQIARLNCAIAVTADAMVRHHLPQILPTLKRLEAESDRVASEGDALDYAKRNLQFF
jgi:hypothetical protein